MGRLFGLKMGNDIKEGHSDALLHQVSKQGFAIFLFLASRLL